MPFTKGHKLAPGGPRPNSGPRPDWLKIKCQKLIEKNNLIEFLANVASGEYTERIIAEAGQTIIVRRSANAETRLKALSMLLDRGFGKPPQDMALTDGGGQPLQVIVTAYSTQAKGELPRK